VFVVPSLYPFAPSFPAKARSTQRKVSEFRCGDTFRRHRREALCGLRVLGGQQQSVSRKGTEHTKKKLQNSVAEMVFVDIAEKNFVAFECFVGINEALPQKAQSAQNTFRISLRKCLRRRLTKTLCGLRVLRGNKPTVPAKAQSTQRIASEFR